MTIIYIVVVVVVGTQTPVLVIVTEDPVGATTDPVQAQTVCVPPAATNKLLETLELQILYVTQTDVAPVLFTLYVLQLAQAAVVVVVVGAAVVVVVV